MWSVTAVLAPSPSPLAFRSYTSSKHVRGMNSFLMPDEFGVRCICKAKEKESTKHTKSKPPSKWGCITLLLLSPPLPPLPPLAATTAPPVDLEKWLSEVLPGSIAIGSFAAPFLLALLFPFVPSLFAGSGSGKGCKCIRYVEKRKPIRAEINAGERGSERE